MGQNIIGLLSSDRNYKEIIVQMCNLKISFIIPCYNAEPYIQGCIESIHPIVPYEIIVVNDGSTDRTSQMVHELMSHYNNIVFIEKENEGVNAARRDGWRIAQGEYVCFVDADDTIESDSAIWKQLDKNYDILKAGGHYISNGNRILYTNSYVGEIQDAESAYTLMLDSHLLPFIHSAIYRKDTIDNDCFDIPSRFKIGEDLLFNVKLMGKAKRMCSVNDAFYNYNMNDTSVMHTKVWGFHYIQAFNDELSKQILKYTPRLEKKVIVHRFLDYTGTLLFPEVKYKHEYYIAIQSLLQQYPWVKSYAPQKHIRFINCEYGYRFYLSLFHFVQNIRGKSKRKLID